MRVALLSGNAPLFNAIGNQIAEKVRFFQERGAEVRLFVQDARRLHPEVRSCCVEVPNPTEAGPVWDYLRRADLVFAVYAQYHDLLQYLPRLAGIGPRLVLDYHGVTPPELWPDHQRERLDQSARQRGYVWCADHALTTSQSNRRELLQATHFPSDHATTLPLVVDTQRFSDEPRERFLQHKLGIDGPILLFVGRIAGNKRVPLLIEALARLKDQRAQAVLIGDCSDIYAEEGERCRTLAEQLGVLDRVHFLDQLNDAELPRAYRSADVLVMPSLHEGFCLPVIEAMACGLPVIASRSAALPETVGDAGLTFVPDDVEDLLRQIRRVLDSAPVQQRAKEARRVAIVCFRFGPDIVGGAETSLRTMAKALQSAGHHVEVFTTCTKSESHWKNELPAGTLTLDGLTVHRFPIDAHDAAAHGEIVRTILEADGVVSPQMAQRYLDQSIHSSALLEALRLRRGDFDAIGTGPYLFGLSADVAAQFAGQTLLVPCFHDEALARLEHWPQVYGNVGGLLYHSTEEQNFAQQRLGINHPNVRVIGTHLATSRTAAVRERLRAISLPDGRGSLVIQSRPYVVYCGRYSAQKNVPLMLDWMRRYQAERPGQLDLVLLGQGDVKLPSESWLHDLGRTDEPTKRSALAGAKALVQLSKNESLSLVALEAWAERTPIIAHRDCAVLAGQIERSQGGITVADYETFANALDDLQANEAIWRERGMNGQVHVDRHYACADKYVNRLADAIGQMSLPIREQMRTRGLQRAQEFARERWQARFAEFVESLLTQPARNMRDNLKIESLRATCQAAPGTRTLLLPVRLANAGTHAAVPEGPGRTVVCCEIREEGGERVVVSCAEMRLSFENEAVASRAPPMDNDLKKRFTAIAALSPGILLEDKGYSIALHYRLAPQFERTIYEAVSAIRSDLPGAAFEVLPGKSVCEIKPIGFTKATGVRELMKHAPFAGRLPLFIGDDVTDESVFEIMPSYKGVSFSVGRQAHGVNGHFGAPKDVRAWLARLLDDDAMVTR